MGATYALGWTVVLTSLMTTATAQGQDDYVACWGFDEGVGAVAHDISANAFDASVHGARWTEGIVGNALAFDGANDFVDISGEDGPPGVLSQMAYGTISLWFRFEAVPGFNRIHPLFYFGGDTASEEGPPGLIIEVGHFATATKLYFTIIPPGGHPVQCFDSNLNLQLHTWYHFAAVVGPGFNTGYLNGAEMTDRYYNYAGPNDDYFFDDVVDQDACWVGRGFLTMIPTDQYLHGVIDELRIYDRPLSAEEIATYYACAIDGPPADLNGDRSVGFSDLLMVIAAWGPCSACPEDLDGNGQVGFSDILQLMGEWGGCP